MAPASAAVTDSASSDLWLGVAGKGPLGRASSGRDTVVGAEPDLIQKETEQRTAVKISENYISQKTKLDS